MKFLKATLLLEILFLANLCLAQNAVPQAGLFESEEILELTMDVSVKELQEDRAFDPDYHHAWISGVDARGEVYKIKVQVKARGNFRRSDVTCDFPPLWVRFSKGDSLGPFAADQKLKLVTHCDKDVYILREYLVYKAFNILTDSSFRVRLCRVTYNDLSGERENDTHYAFFIESINTVAERMGGTELEVPTIKWDSIQRSQLTLVHLFQYMIGNPDHSADRLKNTKLVVTEKGKPPVPVPYDFDWAEIVDASYTKIEGMEDNPIFAKRRFKPLCRTPEEFEACFAYFKQKQDEIYALYENTSLLDDEDKKVILKYFKEFYKTIGKQKKVEEIFIESCRD